MKKFLFTDKTGRGITSTQTLANILTWENEESWDGEELHEWAEDAEQGDEWENTTMKIICTNS